MKRTCMLVGLIVVLSLGLVSFAGAEYPKKDIKFVINAGAGGGLDSICRKIISIAEKNLDVAIYPVNKPGAADALGPFEVMKSRPDGYTVGSVAYNSVVAAVWKQLVPGYDIEKLNNFARITTEPDALLVVPDSPWQTFDELIADAKKRPGEIKIGDNGTGSRNNLLMRQIEEKFGVEFNKVSYVEGSGPQREAILNKEIDGVMASLGDFAPLLNSGDARGLLEFSEIQNVTYPEVPSLAGMGYPELQNGSFITLVVPVDTPADVVTKLEKIFKDAYDSEEFLSWLAQIGVTAAWLGQGEANDFIKSVMEKEISVLDQLKEQGLLE